MPPLRSGSAVVGIRCLPEPRPPTLKGLRGTAPGHQGRIEQDFLILIQSRDDLHEGIVERARVDLAFFAAALGRLHVDDLASAAVRDHLNRHDNDILQVVNQDLDLTRHPRLEKLVGPIDFD